MNVPVKRVSRALEMATFAKILMNVLSELIGGVRAITDVISKIFENFFENFFFENCF